ncbi:nucleolin 2-like [Papaver somniferum]|uniref:nucleolin 2-like n=1 Tax=Papaver somniferum TaxID=3469 RepID=UPI000E6FD157|nr:nucleolin 2-like [Papaver somniferum]XP_026382632.1 nucleolin 2-like [Papaver somniferum]XP_026382633.1 nucleolin 2-like [Papaver somniferum]
MKLSQQLAREDMELAQKIALGPTRPPNTRMTHSTRMKGTGASKTLVAMNLSSSTSKSDVIKFFKWPGDVVDVRFSYYPSGEFRGVCHIEFATEEAAKKAMKLNDKYLLGSKVKLGFSRESIFVRSFDTSSGINEIRSSLKEHFSSCGEILWMHIPKFHDIGVAHGIAFIEFYHLYAFPKALAMNGHKLGDYPLTIEDATPLNLNVTGTGGRAVSSGGRFGPYMVAQLIFIGSYCDLIEVMVVLA